MSKLVLTLIATMALGTSAGCTAGDSTPAQSASTAVLENTYWKVVDIGGTPVTVTANQREPHMVLHSEDNRLAVFGGCNQMSGSYAIDGDKLKLSRMAVTMMACEHGMEHEQALHDALNKVDRWTIHGESLELFDAAGKPVAKFESRYLK